MHICLQCFDTVGFWYRLTRVVPDKGPLNGCVCVCDCSLRKKCVIYYKFRHTYYH